MTGGWAPRLIPHDGIMVVRDDLFPGGTKARYLDRLFDGADEVVYASPAEGGAQTALAHVAASLGKRATIFVAARAQPHPRAILAKRLGARVIQVAPGYLTVVQARAQAYCRSSGARLMPFGADIPAAIAILGDAARSTSLDPDEVWCAGGSGVLARALSTAWPRARMHVVQIGRALTPDQVNGATIHAWPHPFGTEGPPAPFPADPHYDAKAWAVCAAEHGPGVVAFWNVTGPAEPVAC